MSVQKQELNSVIPDLQQLPLERLAELGDSVLAHSIALYRQRLKETGIPLSSFNRGSESTWSDLAEGSTLITTHSLSTNAFTALAGGAGDSVVVRQLREAQLSKHLMLLHVVAEAAVEIDPPSRAAAAFRAGYQLLDKAQSADTAAVARLLGLPHIGSWAHDCLACLDNGSPPDFGYLAAVAAAAAVGLASRSRSRFPSGKAEC